MASGLPVTVTTITGGLVGTPAFIGFGSSAPGIDIVGGIINMSNPAGTLTNFAFLVPRDGTITDISVMFSVTEGLTLTGTTITLRAELYKSIAPDNSMTVLAGTGVDLTPALTGTVNVGDICLATLTGLSVAVTQDTRLMMVITATATGQELVNSVSGYVSAGIAIL